MLKFKLGDVLSNKTASSTEEIETKIHFFIRYVNPNSLDGREIVYLTYNIVDSSQTVNTSDEDEFENNLRTCLVFYPTEYRCLQTQRWGLPISRYYNLVFLKQTRTDDNKEPVYFITYDAFLTHKEHYYQELLDDDDKIKTPQKTIENIKPSPPRLQRSRAITKEDLAKFRKRANRIVYQQIGI
jgi:hypothetical protein